VEEGRRILNESGLTVITAETLAEAAEKAVTAAKSAA
jgi:malate-CoA ligase subunit beta